MDAHMRKEAAVAADLDHINGLLEATKGQGGRGFGDCWPFPLASDAKITKEKRQRTIVDRPVTPVVSFAPRPSRCHRLIAWKAIDGACLSCPA